MSDNIPFEIQVEIMKRLPVKSLAVSRSVSKAWKSMIDSPVFITGYTNMRQQHRLLIRYGVYNDHMFESDFKYVSIMDNDTLSQHPVRDVPVWFERHEELVLVGTSQGLLCLFGYSGEDDYYRETAVIWNPSLGKSIVIDVPFQYQIDLTVLGFGVRPDNCDPMIVMINRFEYRYLVLLFALSSRVWRVPRGNLPRKSIHFTWSSPVATDDRCIYWKAYERSINLVVAFDMVSEDFTEMNLPHSVAHRCFKDFSISKIKESLAVLEYDGDTKKPVYAVWILMEGGVSKSFAKLFTINTPDASLNTKVIGFRKNDQPILETTIDESGVLASLEVYEPRTRTIKNLGINGDHGLFFVSSYTETLLLLDELDGQFVKIQFITGYTNLHQYHRLLIRYNVDTFLSIMDNDTLSQHEFETVSNVPVWFELLDDLVLVGTSQGLLCLFGNSVEGLCYKVTAVIWNPLLGKSIAIDVPCDETYVTVLGFGVRPDNCDPMIVMIGDVEHPNPVMVFTLSSRVWRVPRGNLPPKSIYFDFSYPAATNDRCIYWKASERSINLVVAFDMVSEDFSEINLPHNVAHRSYQDFSISKIKESLAVLEYYDDAEKRVCGVWMMLEDGVSKSFAKLFTINTPDASLNTKVIGFRKNDQPIMETTIDESGVSASLEVYEPRTGTIKNLGINGEHGLFFVSSYTETLLLLDQLNGQFVKIQL